MGVLVVHNSRHPQCSTTHISIFSFSYYNNRFSDKSYHIIGRNSIIIIIPVTDTIIILGFNQATVDIYIIYI